MAFIGKPVGIFSVAWLGRKAGLVDYPAGVGNSVLFGMAILCGIGFTMSLFIGLLAFDDPVLQAEVKLGVLAGSILSALAGSLVLLLAHRERVPTASKRFGQPGVSTVSTASDADSG